MKKIIIGHGINIVYGASAYMLAELLRTQDQPVTNWGNWFQATLIGLAIASGPRLLLLLAKLEEKYGKTI